MSIAAAPLSESASLIEFKRSSERIGNAMMVEVMLEHLQTYGSERAWAKTYQALETPALSMVTPPVPSVATAGYTRNKWKLLATGRQECKCLDKGHNE
jgi:hypothetical protein